MLLDESSMGLAPMIVEEIFEVVQRLNQDAGVSFLLAEQKRAPCSSLCSSWGRLGERTDSGFGARRLNSWPETTSVTFISGAHPAPLPPNPPQHGMPREFPGVDSDDNAKPRAVGLSGRAYKLRLLSLTNERVVSRRALSRHHVDTTSGAAGASSVLKLLGKLAAPVPQDWKVQLVLLSRLAVVFGPLWRDSDQRGGAGTNLVRGFPQGPGGPSCGRAAGGGIRTLDPDLGRSEVAPKRRLPDSCGRLSTDHKLQPNPIETR